MRAQAIGIVLLCACALGACGAKSAGTSSATATSPASSADEHQVRAVVTELLKTKDPSACTRLATVAFDEQNSGEHGAAAVHECRQPPFRAGAKTLTIDRVAVSGKTAEADVRPTGGELPFRTVTFGMLKTGGRWKANRLERATLDRAAFTRVLRGDLTQPPDALPSKTVTCVSREVASSSDVEIVNAYLKPDLRLFVIPVADCSVALGLERAGAAKSVIDCVQAGVRRQLTSGALGRKLAKDPSNLKLLESSSFAAMARTVTVGCVRGAATGTIS
ncbi:MAG TPA: hypothetical protein VGF63_11140 [Solirubrobacteraceae bacterium]|jgi:hypothetical protein